MKPEEIAGLCVVAIITYALGVILTLRFTRADWQDEAVKHNKAEYYLDKEQKRRWRWLP